MAESPSLRKDPFFTIDIKHLPTSNKVFFEGWVTKFSDQYSSNWSEQSVYGRMDPLATFENTQRTITLGFDVVSDNAGMAERNLAKINKLIEFLYPMYENNGPADVVGQRGLQTTLKAAPLLGIRWTNLINNSSSPGYLYGYIKGGLSYEPDIKEGGFIKNNTSSTSNTEDIIVGDMFEEETTTEFIRANSFIPKKVSLSFSFSVLHTHLTGWQEGSGFSGGMTGAFPNAVFIKSKKTVITESIAPTYSETSQLANEALVLEDS